MIENDPNESFIGLRFGPRAQPGVRPPIPPETPGFNETTTGFKFLRQKTRETPNFLPSFTETVHKKKNGRFPLKTYQVQHRISLHSKANHVSKVKQSKARKQSTVKLTKAKQEITPTRPNQSKTSKQTKEKHKPSRLKANQVK